MPRPDPKEPGPGQDALFEATAEKREGQVLRGRHSAAVDRALDAARAAELIGSVDEAAATLLRAGAWSLDAFEAQNKPYGPAKLIDPMVAALREARMTPDSRQTDTDDEIKDLLHALAQPDDANAEIPHAADSGV